MGMHDWAGMEWLDARPKLRLVMSLVATVELDSHVLHDVM